MEKIRIGFTLDHTFRNIYGRIIDLYKKHHIEIPAIEAEENPKLDEDNNPIPFVPPVLNLPISSNRLMEHIPFTNEDEMNEFIFSEFAWEIFGGAKETEPGAMMVFNDWFYKLPENVDVIFFSNDVGKNKSATLFFLSKTGFEGNNIKFIDDTIDIWDFCDILITSSEPKVLKPKDKKLIMIERGHNKELTGDLKFETLYDVFTAEISKLIEITRIND